MIKLVQGIGIYRRGRYTCTVCGVRTKEYQLWINMLQRCYNPKYQDRWPTYKGCSVSESFKDFQYFAEWCNNQIGFNLEDYVLDKDLLFEGNKIYSEDTCVFIPREINALINTTRDSVGNFPTGVCYYKRYNNFQASMRMYGKRKTIGYYSTPDEAFSAYRIAKEDHIKKLADSCKDLIDSRAYNRLLDFKVEFKTKKLTNE